MRKWLALLGMTLGFAAGSTLAELPDFTVLAEKHSPAVVNITTTQDAKQLRRGHKMPEPDDMMEFFLGA